MANLFGTPGGESGKVNTLYRDQGDGSYAEQQVALGYAWDTNALAWVRLLADTTTGALIVRQGTTASLVPAVVNATASGDNSLVAADATRKIKVVSYVIVADAAVSVTWKSGAGTSVSGAMSLAANGGVAMTGQPAAHLLETAANQALVLNLSGTANVRGHLMYLLEA